MTTPPEAPGAQPAPPPARPRSLLRSLLLGVVLLALAGLVALAAGRWGYERATHSLTEDAFVEAHIVNVAPEMVSGRIVRLLVQENDRVTQGQLLAEIDPAHSQDQVNLAKS